MSFKPLPLGCWPTMITPFTPEGKFGENGVLLQWPHSRIGCAMWQGTSTTRFWNSWWNGI